ncbi:MAG: acyl-CoA reductase-like NAD-dependent aldehyde dehydrogenase [Moritella sp.]|jgi:acyl-CoA reductase-like NAD-dependent aldehyde dehydrogenase
MTHHFAPVIPGATPGSNTLPVYSPFNGDIVGTVVTSGQSEVETALCNADALFRDRSAWLTTTVRIAILQSLKVKMQSRFEELVIVAVGEGGKPLLDSRIEVARAIEGVELCIEGLKTQTGSPVPMGINSASEGKLVFTRLEPIGVVVAVSAFNHPLNLIVHQIMPAIATGCPVIVKPAAATPLSCFSLVNLVIEAGLPAGWCQCLLTEGHDLAEKLVTDSRVDFFSFIGSANVGWKLKAKLSPGTRCALEHGGVAPVIVDEHVAVDRLIPKLLKGGFYHAGQVCVSVQRVFVHQSIVDELACALAAAAQALVVGDPINEATEVGPLITAKEVDRVDRWVKSAIKAGALLMCGGEKISDSLYAPTVLLDPPDDCEVSQKEIFGPVVCIYAYSDFDSAIARANALPFAFQASIFSDNLDVVMAAYKKLNASAVMVNEHTAFRVDWMPFAGLKQSGLGVGGIPHTMQDMQIEKMLVISSKEI